MPVPNNHSRNHSSIKPRDKARTESKDQFSFKKKSTVNGSQTSESITSSSSADEEAFAFSKKKIVEAEPPKKEEATKNETVEAKSETNLTPILPDTNSDVEKKSFKKNKEQPKDNWLARRGHVFTYALLFLFTTVLYFRPYELIPGLAGLSSMALYLALATLLIYLPSQLAAEGTLTARPAEVNYVLLIALMAIVTMPIARSPGVAWETFNDTFIKVILMFIVMVNVLRTEKRMKGMIWLALGAGVMLAINGLENYSSGKYSVEGYRAMADIKGMFGNPNAQALHFVTITPIAVALAFAAKNFFSRLIYFALTILFVAGNIVTFSRGGFLGLIVVGIMLAWKLGRENRVKVMLATAVIGIIFIAVAPGNYGLRVLSIFDSSLDPNGSRDQRSELLKTSILVTIRNPWGIGMGNFTLVNPWALVTHNSYTQVSAELGITTLIFYVLLIITPVWRLIWIERELENDEKRDWMYFLAIGLQASIVGYAVCSFFDSAAYQWFLYYIVAYAVCLRRVYQLARERKAENDNHPHFNFLQLQSAKLP